MPAIDVKTIVAIIALLCTGIAGVINVKTDIAKVQSDATSIADDISDIRQTQLATSGRVEKLYDAMIALKLAER